MRQTADGELELAFVDQPLGPQADRVRAGALWTETLLLAVAARDPLSRHRRVRLTDLADRDFVEYRADSSLRASIDAACESAGLRRRVSCEVDTIADLIELVAQGLGISLLPPAAVRMGGEGVEGVASAPNIVRKIILVTPLDRELTPAGRALLDLVDFDLERERGR